MPAASVIEKGALALFLAAAAVSDIRTKQVGKRMVLFAAIAAVILRAVVLKPFSIADVLAGGAVGICFIILSYITGGAVGKGDGAVLVVTGILLGFRENLSLLFSGLILCGMAGLFLLLVMKADRKKEIPFIPFLLAAFVISELIGAVGG